MKFELTLKDPWDQAGYNELCKYAGTDKPEGTNYCEISATFLRSLIDAIPPQVTFAGDV